MFNIHEKKPAPLPLLFYGVQLVWAVVLVWLIVFGIDAVSGMAAHPATSAVSDLRACLTPLW